MQWTAVKSIKETTQAFVVRIWLEPRRKKNAQPVWRGVIERVDNGDRVYFDQLEKMSIYFEKYLTEIGFKVENLEKSI